MAVEREATERRLEYSRAAEAADAAAAGRIDADDGRALACDGGLWSLLLLKCTPPSESLRRASSEALLTPPTTAKCCLPASSGAKMDQSTSLAGGCVRVSAGGGGSTAALRCGGVQLNVASMASAASGVHTKCSRLR